MAGLDQHHRCTGNLVNIGMRLATEGKVLKAGGVVTDGPFVEIRERLGGFIVVKAESLEEATTLAHDKIILMFLLYLCIEITKGLLLYN